MRDALKYIEALATRARCERAPRVNVGAKVLQRLRAQSQPRIDTHMGTLALMSAFAAAIAIALTVWNGMSTPDPFASMIEVSSLLGL